MRTSERELAKHIGGRVVIDADLIQTIVDRVVEVAQPTRILLFGSGAREDMCPESDLDLLVIVRSGVHRRRLAQAVYRRLIGIGTPVDVVVVTEEDVERYRHVSCLVIEPALREGKVVYEREPIPAG